MTTHEVTVASWNIHKGVGTDRRRDLGRTAAVIGQLGADIIALQEVDTRFGIRTGLLNLDQLRLEHGLVPVPVGLGPAHGWHGNLILVRDALVEAVEKIVLPGLEPRGALVAELILSGRVLRVVGAHLGLLPASRAAQTRLLVETVRERDDRPTLLMGDLNEWREEKGTALAHLAQHFARAPTVASFPSRAPLLPLDRIMACNKARLSDLEAHDTPLARRASDHLPIKARLRF
jgi:endonuclease/exonuclease/phosphatase family metal-dependent hydrolase